MKQAEAYDALQDSKWDEILQTIAVMNLDHPFPAVRAREITAWCQTAEFQKLLQQIDAAPDSERCDRCAHVIQETWQFCQTCGQSISS